MWKSIAAALGLAVIVVALKAQLFYGDRFSQDQYSLRGRITHDWDVLSFVGLVTVIYIALEVVVRLVRARAAD